MKKSLKVLLASIASMLFVVSAYAQVTTANLSGKVSDAQGAVPGAAVIATHTPSGTTYYSVADAKGQYRLNGIMPGGPYTVKFEMLGYRVLTINGIIAPLAETLVVDAVLEDESISLEGVVVSADSRESGMNISRSGAGTSISQKTMESLPTVGRSMNDMMRMTPQAASTTSGLSIGGGSYRGSAVTVDGAAFNNAFGIGQNLPAGGSPIALDALEQISVNITPFDVRQSGFQGGAINAVTKGGTNELKASVYNYYTSEKLKGDKIGDAKVTNNHALNNTTGFTVGGPIIKNKLFFFVNAEYSMDEVPGSSYVARESESDPWAKSPNGPANVNRPTVEKLNGIKDFLATKLSYDPGRYQGYSLSTPDWKVLARVDWNINANNKLTARFSATHVSDSNQPSSSMSPIGGTNSSFGNGAINFNRYSAGTQSQYAMYFESSRYFQEQNFYSAAVELNSRLFDGKGANVLRATWSHQYEPRSFVGDAFPSVYILDNTPSAGASFAAGDDTAVYTTFGCDPFTYGNLRDVTTYTVVDELSYTLGMHNLIAGASFETNEAINGFMQGGAGWYVYDSWDSFKADVENPATAAGPSAFMITHANLADPTAQAFPTFKYSQASLYAQDEMNISDYFKLTAGLRFELPILGFDNENINKDFLAVAEGNPNSSFAGLSTADLPSTTISVSPRIGFNWDVLKDRSLIVRGGTGIYTGRIPNVWLVSAIGNANVLQYQYINKDVHATNAANTTNIHFHQDRADVINQLYQGTAFQVADLAAPTGATIISKDLKLPSSWKTSVAVDAKLPFGIKATLEGIYSTNFNEVYASTLGIAKTGTVQLPGEPEARSVWSNEVESRQSVIDAYNTKNPSKPYKSGILNSSLSTMGGYYLHNTDLRGDYYSVTAQLSKTFDFGLDLMAAYTYSGGHSITDGNGDQVYEMVNTYTLGAANEAVLGNSYYIAPNRVIGSATYTIAEGKNFATKIGIMYEGSNVGYIANYSYNRVSYLMNNQSGTGNSQLIYIPTDAEIDKMPFGKLADVKDADNKVIKDSKGNAYTEWVLDDGTMAQAYKDFLASDKYTRKHRGEYSVRNGAIAPWVSRFDVRIAQDFYFNVAGKKNTLELAIDIKNAGNLLNSEWGTYKQLNSATILTYQANNAQTAGTATKNYTFTAPEWKTYNSLASTWQALFSAKLFF